MNSKQLSDEVAAVVAEAQSRIKGVGHDQYAQVKNGVTTQKFETMSMPDLLVYFEEELLDQINYAVMNLLRLRAYKRQFTSLHSQMENFQFVLGSTNAKAKARAYGIEAKDVSAMEVAEVFPTKEG